MIVEAARRSGRSTVGRLVPATNERWHPVVLLRWLAATLCLCLATLAWPGLWPHAAAQGPSGAATGAVRPAVKGPHRADYLQIELVSDRDAVRAGETILLGLRLAHDPGWHTYWRNPGDSGLPTQFEPTLPDGFQVGDIVWPVPERLAVGPLANYGFEGETLLIRPVAVPAQWQGASPLGITVDAQWLVCREICIPGEARLALELPVVVDPAAPLPASARHGEFQRALAAAPDPARAVTVAARRSGDSLVVALPPGSDQPSAEFFPFFEGVVVPAADQRLVKAADDPSQRLLVLSTAADAPDIAPGQARGLLKLGDRALELRLEWQATGMMPGEVVSVAAVRQPSPGAASPLAGARPRESLLSRTSPGFSGGAGGSAGSLAAGAAPGSAGGLADPSGGQSSGGGALLLALGAALAGGLLLNLMPCVFPVIGLKVLSFAAAGEGPASRHRHAFAFAVGVVITFVAMGAVLLGLRAAGQAAGWGFQMQSPLFIAAMSLLFVMIALNLFGVFEVGLRLTTLDSRGEGSAGHFAAGVVAVLVATPCTAPFMGSAVGFTSNAGTVETVAIFAALGVGMAAPYLLFGWVPALVRLLPRPGPWLATFRQFLGFPMLATAAWLAWVLILQAGADGGLRLFGAAILLAFAAWLYGRRQHRGAPSPWQRQPRPAGALFASLAMVAAAAAAGWQVIAIDRLAGDPQPTASAAPATVPPLAGPTPGAGGEAAPSIDWLPWSAEAVERAQAAGRPVFVDFTAAWCISCQANKKIALEREAVRRVFADAGVVALRADWTRSDPAITAELRRHGRNGVPLYLFYGAGQRAPVVLPELLTVDLVVETVRPRPLAGLSGR